VLPARASRRRDQACCGPNAAVVLPAASGGPLQRLLVTHSGARRSTVLPVTSAHGEALSAPRIAVALEDQPCKIDEQDVVFHGQSEAEGAGEIATSQIDTQSDQRLRDKRAGLKL